MASTKSVQFGRYVDIVEIPNRENYSAEEIASIWLQKYDYQRMDEENITLLERMINNKYDTSICDHIANESSEITATNGCTRGLEQFVPERRNRREKTKKDAWNAVIDEQQVQWASGEDDPASIAKVYRQVCIYPMEIAQYRGLMDEKEAKDIQTDMDVDSESGVSSFALYSLTKNKRLARARPSLKRDTYFSISSTRLLKSNLKKGGSAEPSAQTETEDGKENNTTQEEDERLSPPLSEKIRQVIKEESARLSESRREIEHKGLPPKQVEEPVSMAVVPFDDGIELREATLETTEERQSKKREEITETPPSSERLVTQNTQSPGKIVQPAKRSRVRLRASVTFSMPLDIRRARHNHFTTPDCWYSRQEIQKFKVECRHITRDIVAPTGRRRKYFDTRGLEHMIDVQERKKNLSRTIHKVLDEQDRQYEAYEGRVFGVMELERLAEVSKLWSKPSVQEARKRAHKDEQIVLSLWSVPKSLDENNRRVNSNLRHRRSRSQSPTPGRQRSKSELFTRTKSSQSLQLKRDEYSVPSGRRASLIKSNSTRKGSSEHRRRLMIDYRSNSDSDYSKGIYSVD